jgi:hypothetical protein
VHKTANVKQSHYRPGQVLRVPGVWGSHISRQSDHECGKFVNHTHRLSLPPPRKYSWYTHFWQRMSQPRAIMRPEWFYQRKNPMTPSGIEPATFRRVAQCLNQQPHRVPACKNARNGYLYSIPTRVSIGNVMVTVTRYVFYPYFHTSLSCAGLFFCKMFADFLHNCV